MTVQELLNKITDVATDANQEVRVAAFGGLRDGSVAIVRVQLGIDWAMGQLVLHTDPVVALYRPEQQKVRSALAEFAHSFERDFVSDGEVVDNPDARWNSLTRLYGLAKRALTAHKPVGGCK
jgi:hypothetical protein